ncbi:unnamed protein product [Cochlearia groenlandica]
MTSLLGIKRVSKAQNAAFCKKHPKHRQSPGVCSLCLNEKLFLFIRDSSSSRQRTIHVLCSSSTSSSLSSYCSSSVSSCSSPQVDIRCYMLMAKGGSGRGGGGGGGGEGEGKAIWMKKSRSVAYIVGDDEKRKKKAKSGFFFGFVGLRRENN